MAQVDLQKLYDEVEARKAERKMIKASIKDHYDNSVDFKKIKEELDEAKAKKKSYDAGIKEVYGKDFVRILELSEEIKADEDLLSDLCFQELLKNNKVEIKDAKGNDYTPFIKVVFRKAA